MGYRSVDPADIPAMHPVAQIRDVWPALAGSGGIAPWQRFDPLDHPQVLPWVLLLRQDDPKAPDRLRYAICGDGCRQTFGFSYQGSWFGDGLPQAAANRRMTEFAAVRAGRGPVFTFSPLPLRDRDFISVYSGVFGFSSDGRSVDRLLIVLAPENVRLAARCPARPAMTNAAPASASLLFDGVS